MCVCARSAARTLNLALVGHLTRDAHAHAAIRHATAEFVNRRRFVQASKTTRIVGSTVRVVHDDVILVAFGQTLDCLLDVPVWERARAM